MDWSLEALPWIDVSHRAMAPVGNPNVKMLGLVPILIDQELWTVYHYSDGVYSLVSQNGPLEDDIGREENDLLRIQAILFDAAERGAISLYPVR